MITQILPPLPSSALAGVEIMLASNSPRRRELLGMIVPRFEIAPSRQIEESYPDTLAPEQVPVYLSQLKAEAYSDLLRDNELLITADTVVIEGNDILGKPKDAEDAVAMLKRLSGHTHVVVTGVTLSSTQKTVSFSSHTSVTFADVDVDSIRQYVELYKPFDKAGAYGIQEWIGAVAIKGIDGCFYNVMGLPLHDLYTHLREF